MTDWTLQTFPTTAWVEHTAGASSVWSSSIWALTIWNSLVWGAVVQWTPYTSIAGSWTPVTMPTTIWNLLSV